MAWQRIKLDVPKWLSDDQKEQLADDVIEHIRRRTEKGLDKRNRQFPGYSDEYVKSLDFKNGGKRKGRVDLQLSGDMLADLQLVKMQKNAIVIGFTPGSEENARAEGNILGTYGQDKPIPGKKRDFLGISQSELNDILSNYDPEV
jgi:hypothetical protein